MTELLENLDKIHTTELGEQRIKRNVRKVKEIDDAVGFCKSIITGNESKIYRKGKNYYCENDKIIVTINAYSFTIITAHAK